MRLHFSSTVYTFFASEELLESTAINPAHELCTIRLCQWISPQAMGNLCDLVGSLPFRIQLGTMRLLYRGFVYKS